VTARVVQELMGNKPEDRFNFITERAQFVDVDELDV
jgi:DNA gyrase/topoisomerase IV subunit B